MIVNATDASTGAEIVFGGRREAIGLRHVLASMALPGDFAPVEIDGRWLYDGSLSANVAVEALLREPPRGNLVCIVVDLFDRHAKPPTDLAGALRRRQDLPFAAQTCRAYENLRRAYASRATGASVLIVDLVRRDSPDEPATKMYDYSRAAARTLGGRARRHGAVSRASPPRRRRNGGKACAGCRRPATTGGIRTRPPHA